MGPVMLWAEKEESPLLMCDVTGPVMPLRLTSPWLAVTLTGALISLTSMSPRFAVTVTGVAVGMVAVCHIRVLSRESDGDERQVAITYSLLLKVRGITVREYVCSIRGDVYSILFSLPFHFVAGVRIIEAN